MKLAAGRERLRCVWWHLKCAEGWDFSSFWTWCVVAQGDFPRKGGGDGRGSFVRRAAQPSLSRGPSWQQRRFERASGRQVSSSGWPWCCGGGALWRCAQSWSILRRVRWPSAEALALLTLHISCWGVKRRRLRCTSVPCSVLDWSPRAAHALRAGLLLGCAKLRVALVPGRGREAPVAGVSLC